MAARIRNPKDFLAGVLYTGIGLGAIVIAHGYRMGTATEMGPAYFPTVLGGLLIVIGVIAVVRSLLAPGEAIGGFAWKSVALVLGATILFGALARTAGLVPAVFVLVIASAYASIRFRWRPTLALAAALALFCVLVFIKGLGVPLPILGPWFGG